MYLHIILLIVIYVDKAVYLTKEVTRYIWLGYIQVYTFITQGGHRGHIKKILRRYKHNILKVHTSFSQANNAAIDFTVVGMKYSDLLIIKNK